MMNARQHEPHVRLLNFQENFFSLVFSGFLLIVGDSILVGRHHLKQWLHYYHKPKLFDFNPYSAFAKLTPQPASWEDTPMYMHEYL
jgi:hypothetical protein